MLDYMMLSYVLNHNSKITESTQTSETSETYGQHTNIIVEIILHT
jgi:hypothetical protein